MGFVFELCFFLRFFFFLNLCIWELSVRKEYRLIEREICRRYRNESKRQHNCPYYVISMLEMKHKNRIQEYTNSKHQQWKRAQPLKLMECLQL